MAPLPGLPSPHLSLLSLFVLAEIVAYFVATSQNCALNLPGREKLSSQMAFIMASLIFVAVVVVAVVDTLRFVVAVAV